MSALTADLRQRIREARHHQALERVHEFIVAGELEVCTGCGAERDCATIGCKRCHDRHLKYELRKDPAYRERQRVQQNASRARRRLALKGRPAGASPEVASRGKSPVGRRTPVLASAVASNRD